MPPRSPTPPHQDFQASVQDIAHALGQEIPPDVLFKIDTWLRLLVAWNQRIDLSAARNDDELLDLALADALVLAKQIPPQASVIDVGSGAGAPGLPVAMLRPDLRVTLVEPMIKRVSFLRTVIGTTSLAVRVQRCRLEELDPNETWDFAMSRATLAPSPWLAAAQKLVRPASGKVAVMLAKEAAPTFDGARLVSHEQYAWPKTGACRSICLYEFG